MFEVAGSYDELLGRLFSQVMGGRLAFGSARSIAPVDGLPALADGVEFLDYVLEGFVRYFLRTSPSPRGLLLEVRLTGGDRDQHVLAMVARYIRWAGLSPVKVSESGTT